MDIDSADIQIEEEMRENTAIGLHSKSDRLDEYIEIGIFNLNISYFK